ncbi:MAG: hypothetical protein CSA58_01640 [Micrococcales bacterium]|nr:MAG: hypothetical protein CSA58_01640 [Micrococcales bacterium]
MLFARELLRVRNANQKPGYPAANLADVWVYRGLPQSDYDPQQNAWNLAHKAEWEKNPRVHVIHRPLRYVPKYATYSTQSGTGRAGGRIATDAGGRRLYASRREKGIDVMCALAVVREAARDDIDLVILASHDSDLEPALDAAIAMRTAKIETARWDGSARKRFVKQLRTTQRIWNTKLDHTSFERCIDPRSY